MAAESASKSLDDIQPEDYNVLMPIHLHIGKVISPLANDLDPSLIASLLAKPNKGEHELQLPVPGLNRFRKTCKNWGGLPKGNPKDLCAKWAETIRAQLEGDEIIASVDSAAIHLMFKLHPFPVLSTVVKSVVKLGDQFGYVNIGEGKTVVVEYSSPNIAKRFHVGHFRSTVIGNFLKLLHRALGYKVVGINYLGDWGKQYGLLALGYLKFGCEKALKENAVQHLYEVYVKVSALAKENPEIDDEARQYFTRMENGDQEALALWQKFRDYSIVRYKETYKRLNVHFDVYSGESQYQEAMVKAVKELEEKNLTIDVAELERRKAEDAAKAPAKKGGKKEASKKESEEAEKKEKVVAATVDAAKSLARFVDLRAYKLNAVPVVKSDGSTLYITRDIAAAIDRFNTYKFDRMLYVVGAAQSYHFQQLFHILKEMKHEFYARCEHIAFGLVLSESGKGFSSRQGNARFLNDILDEAQTQSYNAMQKDEEKFKLIEDPKKTSDIVGMSGVLIQDLSAKAIKDYTFSWERMLQDHGNTGPYLQYQHVRLASIRRKCGQNYNENADLSLLTSEFAKKIVLELARFPCILVRALKFREAVTVVDYLFKLTRLISSAYEVMPVKKAETKELGEARLLLFMCAKQVLKNGLMVLGCTPLERM